MAKQNMDSFGFFDYVSGSDYEYTGKEEAERIEMQQGTGVVPGKLDSLKVTQGSGLQVNVGAGAVFINGRWGIQRSSVEFTHDAESAGIGRIDTIVAVMDNTTDYVVALELKKGTAAASPTALPLTQTSTYHEEPLADIRVTGSSLISVTDRRTFTATAEHNKTLTSVRIASGTATAIILTIPGVTSYSELALREKTFIASADNGGEATTIRINSLATKPLYKPNTTDAPNLKTGKPYTIILSEDSSHFFLQASAEGNLPAEFALAGYTFSNDDDTGIEGEMLHKSGDNEKVSLSVVGTTLRLKCPRGFYDGTNDFVTATNGHWIPSNIKDGKVIFGVTGTLLTPFAYQPNLMSSLVGYVTTFSSTFVKVREVTATYAGTYRCYFDLSMIEREAPNVYAYGQIAANGMLQGSAQNKSTYNRGSENFTQDVTVSAGQNIQLYIRTGYHEINACNLYFTIVKL